MNSCWIPAPVSAGWLGCFENAEHPTNITLWRFACENIKIGQKKIKCTANLAFWKIRLKIALAYPLKETFASLGLL